jgi:hypothetical protein
MSRKIIPVLLFIMVGLPLFSQTAIPPATGDGTSGNPYQIATAENLVWLSFTSDVWDKHFIQTHDIDLSESSQWNGGWQPVGNVNTPFTGNYNGQGKAIYNLFINRPDNDYQGFFGLSEGGLLQNIQISNARITGYNYVAILAGKTDLISQISHCTVNGEVAGFHYTGGIAGFCTQTNIISCKTSGNLQGSYYSGGICGWLTLGTITHCHSNTSISGGVYTGGITGQNSSLIKDSYFTGNIEGALETGGIAGINAYLIKNSFYDFENSHINNECIITEGAIFQEHFEDWIANDLTLDINEYLVQEDGVYLIHSFDELKHLLPFGQINNTNYKLMDDIDLVAHQGFYIPYFRGNFNGNNHKIKNLSILESNNRYTGLFGKCANATLSNLSIEDFSIYGYIRSGGLAGEVSYTFVENCSAFGNLTSNNIESGLLVGRAIGSTIENCFSVGDLHSNSVLAGGLSGSLKESVIKNSYSLANIQNTSANTGGLAGEISWSSVISHSYYAGAINSGEPNQGGISGKTDESSEIINSFWDTEVSGIDVSAGGTGLNSEEMKNIQTYLAAGWDFINESQNGNDDIWGIDEQGIQNEGYPFLSWQNYSHVQIPVVSTLGIEELAPDYAIITAELMVPGYPAPYQHGICWNTAGNPTIADSHTENGAISQPGTFSDQAEPLSSKTQYFVRAYVLSDAGIFYGNEIEFITPAHYYTLLAEVTGNGIILVNGSDYSEPASFEEGTTLNLLAVAGEGWKFDNWSGDWETQSEQTSLVLNGNMEITANFSPATYTENSHDEGITIAPNPFSDYIQVNGAEKLTRLKLYNSSGNIILHESPVPPNLNTQSLKPGIYFLILEKLTGSFIQMKIVKGNS